MGALSYKDPKLREIMGSTLHPGGLTLTRRGLDLCGWQASDRLLDIGCGPGATLGLMRDMGFKAYGLDNSEALLAEAQKRGPVFLADAACIPLPDGTLDGASMECVLSLMQNKAQALDEAWRVLRPGARLLVSDIFLREAEGLAALRGLLQGSGFEIIHEFDETKRLAELAARIIFKYGSTDEFFRQWGQGKKLGYIVFIAEKRPK